MPASREEPAAHLRPKVVPYGGELRGEGVYVAREKTAVFKENVKVTGMLSVKQTDVTVRIEGASIAKLKFSEGSCRISSGSVVLLPLSRRFRGFHGIPQSVGGLPSCSADFHSAQYPDDAS